MPEILEQIRDEIPRRFARRDLIAFLIRHRKQSHSSFHADSAE